MQISAHVRRIETVEKDLKALSDASSSKADLSRLRAEVKKIYDGLHIGALLCCVALVTEPHLLAEVLDLRTFVWGLRAFVSMHVAHLTNTLHRSRARCSLFDQGQASAASAGVG